ncbi:MAG: hypothetical protein JWQ27_2305 [Ferruginibacter sp.]|nr:hypothetical protein [Ferruginibacter sp.]
MKVPFDEARILSLLTTEEQNAFSFSDHIFRPTTLIYNTKDLAPCYKKAIQRLSSHKFEVFKLNPISVAVVLAFLIFFLGRSMFITHSFNPFILSFVLFLGIAFIAYINADEMKICLEISASGIQVNEIFYTWNSVYETYIVSRPQGKTYLHFLIIATDSGIYDRYQITNLEKWVSIDSKLSAYIEYYKNFV